MQETGIGRGRTMMTPLHNMMIAASVANDGVMMTPYIVDSISDSEGRTVVKNKPTEAGTVMSAEEAGIPYRMHERGNNFWYRKFYEIFII